jgi:hypothetical protein
MKFFCGRALASSLGRGYPYKIYRQSDNAIRHYIQLCTCRHQRQANKSQNGIVRVSNPKRFFRV